MLDSLLGATLQASYWCPRCDKATESRIHRCGVRSNQVRGINLINNDVVNFAATLAGALFGGLVYILISYII